MSFNWGDYLALADTLARQSGSPGPEEAALRSAISRSYYAAFCSARNAAETRKEITPSKTGKDHELVIRHFEKSHDLHRRKIGMNLRRLRDNRNHADYDNTLSGPPKPMAQSSVALANNVLAKLNSL